jgi:molybdopterin/thiamine biosynthesis adenylyltransferase
MQLQNYIAKFSRHVALPNFGKHGLDRLKNSSALIVGAGGLGVPIAQYLAASGLGNLSIIDHDVIDFSNLSRQIIYAEDDVGKKKSLVLYSKLNQLHSHLNINYYDYKLTEKNAKNILTQYDFIINASDNFQTRYIINFYSCELKKSWLDLASVGYEGQMALFINERGCYHCLFPNVSDTAENCNDFGIFSPVCGVIASLGASETIKFLIGIDNNKENYLYKFNSFDLKLNKFSWEKNIHCQICNSDNLNKNLKNYNTFINLNTFSEIEKSKNDVYLNLIEVFKKEKNKKIIILDFSYFGMINDSIFENEVFLKNNLSSEIKRVNLDYLIKENDFINNYFKLKDNVFFICLCEYGKKSEIACAYLQGEGFLCYKLGLLPSGQQT